MRSTLLALAASVALTGAALAQTTAPGSAEQNMNNPGSVKSNAQKGMPQRDMPATTGTVTAPPAGATADAPSTSGHSGGSNTSSGTVPTSR
ncbi:MAG: hypothetical protein K2X71_06175 [Methylobacterium sp.]|uniref:hypothetical protein n=1 Tax=Methylobacterium sp. TaxID=409 RepID=UPI00258506BA|nr:hypothetical protein [Methylobacterium sp.]MBY0295611.1 hypothetical protein [Methylobacterium sp.]